MARSKERIGIGGVPFQRYIPAEHVNAHIDSLARQILTDYDGRPIQFLHVAMGGVFFAVELARSIRNNDPAMERVPITHNLSRLELWGPEDGGQIVRDLAGFRPVADQHIIIVDEVVRSGKSVTHLQRRLWHEARDVDTPGTLSTLPASVAVAAMIDKPHARGGTMRVNYAGFQVPYTPFLIGRGMDLEGLGHELPDIYQRTLDTDYIAPPDSYSMPVYMRPSSPQEHFTP